ncbi:hypothetical protein BC834DRAFT_1044179 [Gloeopeniophorella convolvens]|nr:hypothetical protein BC834DRAFT_1044179 [Gloeopeniophorella convolvens]
MDPYREGDHDDSPDPTPVIVPPASRRSSVPSLIPATPILSFHDDVLLEVFDAYRLNDEYHWKHQRGWYRLVHVCRRWRHVVLASASRLDLHLHCTSGTPVADMLTHSPPLPIIIDYYSELKTITEKDEDGLLAAMPYCHRVRLVSLGLLTSSSSRILKAMDGAFPILESLALTSVDNTGLILPKTFSAPRLNELLLQGVVLSLDTLSLTPAINLVTLRLDCIPENAYFAPEHLAALLVTLPHLREISIGFLCSPPRRVREPHNPQIVRATLPSLTSIKYRGGSIYLDALVARINTPHLEGIHFVFFNQLTLSLPRLTRFFTITPKLVHHTVDVALQKHAVSIEAYDTMRPTLSIEVRIPGNRFDWQVFAAAQICGALAPILSAVEVLKLRFYAHELPLEMRGEVERNVWHSLLRPFNRAEQLRVASGLLDELSRALQPDDSDDAPVTELLPALGEFWPMTAVPVDDGFSGFINACRLEGRVVPQTHYRPKAVDTIQAAG